MNRQLIKILCIALLAGVATLFAAKYAMRVTPHFIWVAVSCFLVYVVMAWLLCGQRVRAFGSKALFYAVLVAVLLVMLVVQYHFDPYQLRVDRWSALHFPIQHLLRGEFPYLAHTHLDGSASPFPVWQLFHIPFYLLGNVGLSEMFTFLLFVLSVRFRFGVRQGFLALLLGALTLNIWYEVSVRSDMISNFLLLAAFVNLLFLKGVRFEHHPLLLSFIAGLWLSTRLNTVFPLAILFFPAWLTFSVKKKGSTVLIALLALIATFVPLMLWDASTLFYYEYSPLALQTRQGHPVDPILMLLFAMLCGWWWRGIESRYHFLAGVSLLLVPVITYGHTMLAAAEPLNIFDSWCDITYLDAAIPFLIMSLCAVQYEEEKDVCR